MSSLPRKIKTISSHAGHARFLAETGEKIVGEVLSSALPRTPYAYSLTKSVLSWNGRSVVVCETSHKRFEVIEVPASMVSPVSEEV